MEAPRVWVDDRHPIFLRGLAACLASDGITISGESAELAPLPDPAALDILVFEADGAGLQRAPALARPGGLKLVALMSSPDEALVGRRARRAPAPGALLQAFLVPGDLPAEVLPATLAVVQPAPSYTLASPRSDRRADFWSALGGRYKPGLDLVVTAAVEPRPGRAHRTAGRACRGHRHRPPPPGTDLHPAPGAGGHGGMTLQISRGEEGAPLPDRGVEARGPRRRRRRRRR
jgi:hypothetical protein